MRQPRDTNLGPLGPVALPAVAQVLAAVEAMMPYEREELFVRLAHEGYEHAPPGGQELLDLLNRIDGSVEDAAQELDGTRDELRRIRRILTNDDPQRTNLAA